MKENKEEKIQRKEVNKNVKKEKESLEIREIYRSIGKKSLSFYPKSNFPLHKFVLPGNKRDATIVSKD